MKETNISDCSTYEFKTVLLNVIKEEKYGKENEIMDEDWLRVRVGGKSYDLCVSYYDDTYTASFFGLSVIQSIVGEPAYSTNPGDSISFIFSGGDTEDIRVMQ